MPTGAVTAVRTNKEDEYAFCFIKCAEEKGKIFCHVSTLQGVDDPAATIKKGVYLTFDISKDEQGRIAAQNAKIASDADKAKAESDIAAATAASSPTSQQSCVANRRPRRSSAPAPGWIR